MRCLSFLAILSCLMVSCTRTIYVVRHAEKAAAADSASKMMTNDPPLSEAGKVRAIVLKDELKNKHIKHIFSTNTIRTRATAEPLSQSAGTSVIIYSNIDSLVNRIEKSKGNMLVVGHSNTVDDIVNKLCGGSKISGDLGDKEYDNLFIVKMRGKMARFTRHKYGYPSNP